MLEIYSPRGQVDDLEARARSLQAAGFDSVVVVSDELEKIEPALQNAGLSALLHNDCAHVVNPLRLSQTLLDLFRSRGGTLFFDDIRIVTQEGAQTIATAHSGARYRSDYLVVSAGMASRDIMHSIGSDVPLQAERGYHAMIGGADGLIKRPLIFHREGFAVTPMDNGLRLAGTVEFASADAPPNWRRADRLRSLAQRYFRAELPPQASRWMGSRPSFPDSLPAIGTLKKAPLIAYAFGHQHLGLTQAAITARLVVSAITGDQERDGPLSRLNLSRFS